MKSKVFDPLRTNGDFWFQWCNTCYAHQEVVSNKTVHPKYEKKYEKLNLFMLIMNEKICWSESILSLSFTDIGVSLFVHFQIIIIVLNTGGRWKKVNKQDCPRKYDASPTHSYLTYELLFCLSNLRNIDRNNIFIPRKNPGCWLCCVSSAFLKLANG